MPLTRMPKLVRFLLLQMNGLFPFLNPARRVFANGNILRGAAQYVRDCARYQAMPGNPNFPLKITNTYPCLYDRYSESGEMPLHYFHQDIWAARLVRKSGVAVHYDFGSRIDGFVAHCLSFCDLVLFDIRDLTPQVKGLSFIRGDITHLDTVQSGSVPSLSSLHAIEHVGLGRYGDSIDPDGYRKAIAELQRIAAPEAPLYIGVPIGNQRLEFNAQRVFDPEHIVECFKQCDLLEFSAVDDDNAFVPDADLPTFKTRRYSCGLFHFVKKAGR